MNNLHRSVIIRPSNGHPLCEGAWEWALALSKRQGGFQVLQRYEKHGWAASYAEAAEAAGAAYEAAVAAEEKP
jgi:hypothetical protein